MRSILMDLYNSIDVKLNVNIPISVFIPKRRQWLFKKIYNKIFNKNKVESFLIIKKWQKDSLLKNIKEYHCKKN